MKKITIIGGGFSGILTAVNLIERATSGIEINIIGEKNSFAKGIAYIPYSKNHLLNVTTARMSAFENKPDHFLNWVLEQPKFKGVNRDLIAGAFLPRYIYGEYITYIWNNSLNSTSLKINIIHNLVTDLVYENKKTKVQLDNNEWIESDICVIANGNSPPRNPSIKNTGFYTSANYFQNPWLINSVQHVNTSKPILIIGNGLTMVDTVMGLREQHFTNTIYSISANGFNILPHRHSGLKYTGLVDELKENITLRELVSLINKHIRLVRSFGVSAVPVIDSLRPYTQKIWLSFSDNDKQLFISRLRHLWGVARHRFPTHIHDFIQQQRIDGKLHILSGKLLDMNENNGVISVDYKNNRTKEIEQLEVGRVINCTGPESSIANLKDHFLNKCLQKGVLTQDKFLLGINADPKTYEILNKEGTMNENLFTLGTNLRGLFWESTAVGELRKQTEQLATTILSRL